MVQRTVVVVGASAGGVRALRELVGGFPPDWPVSVCVVLHVGEHTSLLPDLLSRSGPLPAVHAQQGEPLEPGRIYVAPPDRHLLIQDNALQLTRGPKEHHTRPAVDPLFRSAALSHGTRAVGVLMTGRLDDGTSGLQAIKQCGGLVLVQDPAGAEEPGMPLAALRSVQVDRCVPLAGMAGALIELVDQVPREDQPSVPVALAREQLIGQPGINGMEQLKTIAHPSALVCPDCGGGLWEIDRTKPPRYRCHTGHGYSLRTLAQAQAEAGEQALWSALRALEDKEVLLRRIAALDREAGDEPHAARMDDEAQAVARQIELLQRMVLGGER